MDLNKIQLMGYLTADPEGRKLPSGRSVAQFRLVTQVHTPTRQATVFLDKTEYHQIVAFDRLADVAAKYLKKGDRVYLDGQLTTRMWEGQGGAKRSRTEIVMQNLIMLGGGKQSGRKKRNDDVVSEKDGE
ncbi:single-stranded DNA-binding protein, partial [candidate division GN15 bacterium]|nr:single-stranded DNA-binding protein [candidate division GN15 bacterium]